MFSIYFKFVLVSNYCTSGINKGFEKYVVLPRLPPSGCGVKLLVSVDDLSHPFTAEIKVYGTLTSTNPDIHTAQVLHSTHRLCYQIICWKVEDFDYPEDRGFFETSVTNHHCVISQTTAMVIKNAVQTLYRILYICTGS